jgi:phosphate transport system protein
MTHFETSIDGLRQRLLTMASYAAQSIRTAVRAVVERDDELGRKVEEDDSLLDDLEKVIDELAIQLLLRAPLARDLRLIMVATKVSHDLERVGDEATAIARRARDLNREPQLKAPIELPRMASMVTEMLAESLDAFITGDCTRARAIIPRDKQVDALNKQLQRELTALIVQSPDNTNRCLNLMAISKRLERVGDHAKNIAEEVVYLHEATDIRHTQRVSIDTPPAAPAS